MEPGTCHFQTLENAPSKNSSALQSERRLALQKCVLAWHRLRDGIFTWPNSLAQKERRQHKHGSCLRKMLADSLLCLTVLAVVWQFMGPCLWEGHIPTSRAQHVPSLSAATLPTTAALHASSPTVADELAAADVWSISYPQGGGEFAKHPFELPVGRSVEIFPQLVATKGTTCFVEPSLPAGLALNKSTCIIQGVPTQETASSAQTFVITAANSNTSASAHVVLAVGAALPGTISTVAGRAPEASSGFEEELWQPESLCVHKRKLYIGQQCGIAEMHLDSPSEVAQLLGDGGCHSSDDGGEQGQAGGGPIRGLVVYKEELYFADWNADVVHKVGLAGSEAPGLLSRVAGTGEAGFAGDGGQAIAAKLESPWGLAVLHGTLVIADSWNHCIRAVDLESGIITTVAGTPGSEGFAGDGGPAGQARLSGPRGLLVVGKMLYAADAKNHRIRSIDFEQSPPKIATFAGGGEQRSDGAPAAEWQLRYPTGLTLGLDGKMNVVCRRGSHTVLAIDMQQPHHPTRIVAGIGEEGEGADFTVATSSALSHPSAAAAVGEGAIYIAEWGRIRAVTVAKSIEEVPFLGTWSSLKPDGTLASPFSLPASTAYISPALPTTASEFHFSLEFDGLSFPPSVLGVADMESIKKLATNLQPNGTDTDFNGVAIMLIPEAGNEPLTSIPFPAAVHAAQGTEAITVTGWVSRTEFGDRCEYALKDVMLSEMPATAQASSPMITPHVGIDVPMHVFMAAWGPATQLRIIVENPPLLERSWT